MKGSIAIQMLPFTDIDKVTTSIDKVIHYIEESGLSYEVGPFETTIEGEFDELMELLKVTNKMMLEEDIDGHICNVKINFMRDAEKWSTAAKTDKFRH